MTDFSQRLAAKTKEIIPGQRYNDHRREVAADDARAGRAPRVFYEAVLSPNDPALALAERVMPPFVRYLAARGFDPAAPRGLTVALFLGEHCHLLEAEDLVSLFLDQEGMSRETFRSRMRSWLTP